MGFFECFQLTKTRKDLFSYANMCACLSYECSTCGGHKRVADHLEEELQMVVSCHGGARN